MELYFQRHCWGVRNIGVTLMEEIAHQISSQSGDFFLLQSGVCLRYLIDYPAWTQCTEPRNIVEWNIILLSILIALSGLQLIICILKVAAELKRTLCGTYSVFVQVTKHLRLISSGSPCHCSFSNFSWPPTPSVYAFSMLLHIFFPQNICW